MITNIIITIDKKGGTKVDYGTAQAKFLIDKINELNKSNWRKDCNILNLPKEFALLRFKDIELFRTTFDN
jgi:hypothetical protein